MHAAKQRKRRSGGSTHMRCRAEAILKLLSGGGFFEVNIRRVLGDSPDTSKALRMYSLSLLRCYVSLECLINVVFSVSSLGVQKIIVVDGYVHLSRWNLEFL